MKLRSAVFAVAITVLLLMALTMNFVSAESPAKLRLNPEKQEVELKLPGQYKVKLPLSEPMALPVTRARNELIYDDGEVDGAYCWSIAGGGFAVRFTPPSYPAEII